MSSKIYRAVLFAIIACSAAAHALDDDGHLLSVKIVGSVFCDTCYKQHFSKNSYFISGAPVAVECRNNKQTTDFRTEAKTNEYGQFKVELGPSIFHSDKQLKRCSVTLLQNEEQKGPCKLVSIANSSSFTLKSKQGSIHTYSAGFFSYRPQSPPPFCSQDAANNPKSDLKASLQSSKVSELPPISLPPLPLVPPLPPLSVPPIPFPFPTPPALPLPANPFQPPPLISNPLEARSLDLLPPIPLETPPLIPVPPLPQVPPLIPLPPLPEVPPLVPLPPLHEVPLPPLPQVPPLIPLPPLPQVPPPPLPQVPPLVPLPPLPQVPPPPLPQVPPLVPLPPLPQVPPPPLPQVPPPPLPKVPPLIPLPPLPQVPPLVPLPPLPQVPPLVPPARNSAPTHD